MAAKYYFASDFHFGIPDRLLSLQREERFISWLEEVRHDAAEIFLMGDLFDFWFEYRTVVPKGFVRLLGKLAEVTDSGIPVHMFRGNHDVWAFDYLEKEVGLQLHREPEIFELAGRKFFLAHGDGLGPGDRGYKMLKKVFECRFCQWLFNWLHPDLGTRMALYFSRRSRLANVAREGKTENAHDPEEEMIVKYARSVLKERKDIDYFIFGHRHMPVIHPLQDNTRLVLLGDWLLNFTYGVFDGQEFKLKSYSDRVE